MRKPWTKDDDLTFHVEMGLMQTKVPSKRRKDETRDEIRTRRRAIAQKIVAFLKLSNWTFERGPTTRGPFMSSAPSRSEQDED